MPGLVQSEDGHQHNVGGSVADGAHAEDVVDLPGSEAAHDVLQDVVQVFCGLLCHLDVRW